MITIATSLTNQDLSSAGLYLLLIASTLALSDSFKPAGKGLGPWPRLLLLAFCLCFLGSMAVSATLQVPDSEELLLACACPLAGLSCLWLAVRSYRKRRSAALFALWFLGVPVGVSALLWTIYFVGEAGVRYIDYGRSFQIDTLLVMSLAGAGVGVVMGIVTLPFLLIACTSSVYRPRLAAAFGMAERPAPPMAILLPEDAAAGAPEPPEALPLEE